MFLKFFGRRRKPATLSQRDWDRFIRARRAGRVGPSGRPVSNRTIEYDLKFLLAVLNWAARSRDEEGRLLLESGTPLKVLCELGGWKTAETVLQCYQRADEDQLRKALEERRRVSIPAN